MDNQKQLEKLFSLMNPKSFTTEDFIKNYKIVIEHVVDIKKQLAQTLQLLNDDFAKKKRELSAQGEMRINNLRSEVVKIERKSEKKIDSLTKKVQKAISEVKDGLDGKDADENIIVKAVLDQIELPKIEEIEKRLPKLSREVRDALELLQGDERLEMSAIKGLEKRFKELTFKMASRVVSGFGGQPNNSVQYYDLSSQVDGSTKTFEVPRHRKVIQLTGTQYPIILRPEVDFTTANKTLTLTSEVEAPKTGQSLIFLYIK